MRGFKVGKKLVQLWRRRRPPGYIRLDHSDQNRRRCGRKTMGATICDWGRRLTSKLRRAPAVAVEYPKVETAAVPKGHLAVYVGKKECGGGNRYLVPVIYFNHPLFGELLREAEEEFGFQHPGGITIPCPEAEFESVRMKIAATGGCGGESITRKLSRRRLFLTGKGRKEF